MNILILGNPYLTESLNKFGHKVATANYSKSCDLSISYPVFWKNIKALLINISFTPDIVFYADNGNLPCLIDPESIDCPSIYYSIDTYCNPWHVPYAHCFDMTYVAQKDFLYLFKDDCQNASWQPLFCKQEGDVKPFSERKIPVSFVGGLGHKNNPGRLPFLQSFKARHEIYITSGDFRPIFNNSRIVLNQTAFGEINFRCFEAMSLGAALLMEKCENGFDELFVPGENILPTFTRNDSCQAAKIASIWLERPAALAAIAENGRRLVLEKHGEDARSVTLLKDSRQLLSEGNWRERLNKAHLIRPYSRAAFGALASELADPTMREYRDFFHKLAVN